MPKDSRKTCEKSLKFIPGINLVATSIELYSKAKEIVGKFDEVGKKIDQVMKFTTCNKVS